MEKCVSKIKFHCYGFLGIVTKEAAMHVSTSLLLLSRKVSLFKQFFKEFVHLLIETFEKSFAEDERVIIHNQQVYDILPFIIGKYKGVGLHDVQAIELAIILHLDQQGT